MAWSRQTLEANRASVKGGAITFVAKTSGEASRKRISKRVEPATANAPSRKKKSGDVRAALTATPELPPLRRPRSKTAPLNVETRDPAAPLTTAPEPPLVPKLSTGNAPVTEETSNPPRERTPQELVMAALAVADQITNAETPKALGNDRTDEIEAGDANVSISMVALLLSRPDVKSAAELKGLNVAIDVTQSAIEQDVQFALAAVGATEVQLSVSDANPLDRLISGDVKAAVLKLVSPDAAEAFPDIRGFKVLRVPLSPH
jgi:hypothetical protein